MADNKGLFFNPQITGLATILSSDDTERTRQRLSMDEQRKVAAQVKAKEDRDKRADQLKQFDSWRYYSPALAKEYESIVDDVKNDRIDNFELKLRLNDYATKAQSSMQLKGEYDDAVKDYQANKKVLGNTTDWYLDSYHKDPSTTNLQKISSSPLNRYGFLDESGGSKYLNETNSFNDVIEKSLGGWVENEIQNSAAKGKVIARGLLEFQNQHDTSKLKSFSTVDPKTGQITIQDADKLIDSGVLNLFEQDAYTNRILEDRTDQIIGKSEVSPEDRERVKTQVLRQYLQPYGSAGQFKSDRRSQYQRFASPNPPSGGGGSGRSDDSEARRIYDVFKSRSVGEGADVGEEKTYTKSQVEKFGLNKSLIGKKYIESKALEGYKDEAGRTLGRIVFRPGDTRFGNVARVAVFDKDGNEKWQSLTLNQLESFLPRKVYDQVEQLARGEGRIDSKGNFIYRPADDLE